MCITVLLEGSWDEEYVEYLERLLLPEVILIREPGERNFDILVCGRPDESLLRSSPLLRHLIIPWAGVPVSTAKLLASYSNITVHNIHHNAVSASEMAVSLTLAAARQIVPSDRQLRLGDWSWRSRQGSSVLIHGSRILILGYGSIGRRIGSVFNTMGASVSGIRRGIDGINQSDSVTLYPPDQLHSRLKETDILVLCLPLTVETEGIIGDEELDLLHNRSIVVNVGRGKLIDEKALYEHLRNGLIGSAGIDVWYSYPASDDSIASTQPSSFAFRELDNVVMTPHLGGAYGSDKTEKLRMQHLAASINSTASGKGIPGKVDLELGY